MLLSCWKCSGQVPGNLVILLGEKLDGNAYVGFLQKLKVVSRSVIPVLCDLKGLQSTRLLLFSARILEWLAIPFPRDFPDPGIEPGSPALQADSLQSEPPGNLIFVEDIQILFSYLSDSQIDTVEKMGPIFLSSGIILYF